MISIGQLEMDLADARRMKAVAEKERNVAREHAARYERFLRAMVDLRALVDDGSVNPIYPSLSHQDTMEWLEEQASNLLDFGMEATCPHCCTNLHAGACGVAESEEED